MPYVVRSARPPIASQLSQYVRVVKANAVKGMGDDGGDDGFGDDGDTPISVGESGTPVMPIVDPGSYVLPTDVNPLSSTDLSNLAAQAQAESAGIGSTISNAYAAATAPSAGGGFNLATFMSALASGATAGAKIYNSTQSPYLIAGTSSLYNPATGQIMGLPVDTSSLLIYGGLAVGAFVLISMFTGKK
jgi:hypothetical protein